MGVKKEEKKTLKTDKTEKISKFALKLSELRKERGISQKNCLLYTSSGKFNIVTRFLPVLVHRS